MNQSINEMTANNLNKNNDRINMSELPTDILFPAELNRYLREQVQSLEQENQLLKNSLKEKDVELIKFTKKIENFQTKIKQYEYCANLDSNNKIQYSSQTDLAASKIVELSKKNRELNSELESYKTKCTRLENKVKQLTVEPPICTKQNNEEKKPEDPTQIKLLSDKLAATTKKLYEIKNQNITLSNELKQANKLLTQEIGDGFTSVTNFTQNSGNWRGRAQQIITLQQKLSEYQEKLSSCPTEKDCVTTTTTALKQIETNKRLIQEQLTKELNETKLQLDETKKRLDGSKARTKILESDVANIKMKLNTLIGKSEHDDQLIKALTNKININESAYQDKIKYLEEKYYTLLNEYNSVKNDLKISNEKEIELKKLITDKDDKINELKVQIRQNYQHGGNISNKPSHDEIDSIQNGGINVLKLQEQTAICQATNAERSRLQELIIASNCHLDDIRRQFDETRLELKRERQKVRKLEEKLWKLENVKATSRTGYARNNLQINCSNFMPELDAVNELKNKLELSDEKILLLQTRIDTLEDEKRMQIENFNLMLENTRKIFRDELNRISNSNRK